MSIVINQTNAFNSWYHFICILKIILSIICGHWLTRFRYRHVPSFCLYNVDWIEASKVSLNGMSVSWAPESHCFHNGALWCQAVRFCLISLLPIFQKTVLQQKNVDKENTTIIGPSTANKIERLWRQVCNSLIKNVTNLYLFVQRCRTDDEC